jgi:hypothetical protein
MRYRNVGKTKYAVGNLVTFFRWPVRRLAQVIELRGPLGRSGMQIYRLREDSPLGEVRESEHPEDALEPAEAPARASDQPAK